MIGLNSAIDENNECDNILERRITVISQDHNYAKMTVSNIYDIYVSFKNSYLNLYYVIAQTSNLARGVIAGDANEHNFSNLLTERLSKSDRENTGTPLEKTVGIDKSKTNRNQ